MHSSGWCSRKENVDVFVTGWFIKRKRLWASSGFWVPVQAEIAVSSDFWGRFTSNGSQQRVTRSIGVLELLKSRYF